MPIDIIGMVRTLLELAVGLLSKMEDDGWATDTPSTVMTTRAPNIMQKQVSHHYK